jgi:hypothetical protein
MRDSIRPREARRRPTPSAGGRLMRSALLALVLPPLLLGLAGCTRRFFRNRADLEVDDLLAEKSHDPRWDLTGMHVYPNPLARFADCTNPDRPPMPPDDPAAYDLSPNPQKPPHAGIAKVEGTGYLDLLAQWDQENRARLEAARAEERRRAGAEGRTEARRPAADPTRPDPAGDLARAEEEVRRELADAVTTDRALPEAEAAKLHSHDHPFLVTLEQCVELGLINSREYQTRREELYLAALPVTVERFAFSSQLFFAEQIIRTRAGRQAPGGFANNWTFNTTAGVSKLFSTGALLLLRFANQTVYNLGNTPSTSVSTLSLDFIQPLLRGGGRAVTLEPLTQAERNLLYAVRDFAKFRQEFYVYIASGQATFIPGVQAGVQALTGGTVSSPNPFVPGAAVVVVPTAFTGAGALTQVSPGEGGRLFPIGPAPAPPRGYLTTLADKWNLINQYRNIADLTRFVRRFEVYVEGGIVQPVQRDQVTQQRLRSIDSVLAQQATHRSNMDQFKLQLGIPLNIPLELDDGPLQPILDQTRRLEDISSSFQATADTALGYGGPEREEVKKLRGRLRDLLVNSPFTRGSAAARRVLQRWRAWEALPPGPAGKDPVDRKLEALRRERIALLKRAKLPEGRDLPEADRRRLAEIEADLAVGLFESDLRDYERRPWERQKDPALRAAAQARLFFIVHREFLALLEETFRERTEGVRRRWPALPEACVEGFDLLGAQEDEAIAAVTRAALTNRLDLMNQRAQVVDSWRKIAVAANALLGTFNVEYSLDTTTPANVRQPFNFGGSRTRNRLVLNTELPLVRVIERNNYRSALIAYQQARRALQSAEDQVLFAARLDLRQLRELAYNYHTVQKPSVELAYRVVDLALEAFTAPAQPTGPAPPTGAVGPPTAGPGGGGGGGDPAALTQQLLMAQNSLLGVQNDLYNTWIGYLTTRMSLYRDLGIMPLDPRGVWIDDVARCCDTPAPDARLDRPDRPSGGEGQRPQQLPDPRPIATTPGAEAGPGR